MLTLVLAAIAFAVGSALRRDCACAELHGHLWRPCGDDEPREENGVCVRCGLYASEGDEPCEDHT